jgi:O-antigen ligase
VGSWAVPASLLLVAAVSPFERPLPGVFFGFTLTTLELSVVAALAAAAITLIREPRAFQWRTPITFPLIALVVCAMASAINSNLVAHEFAGNAVRASGRLAIAVLLFTAVANAAASTRVARQIIAVLVATGAVVGAVAVLELAQAPFVHDALKIFRPGFHVVGGQLRATSTLFYPTIASMYLEVIFALGLIWVATSRLAFVALVAIGAGAIATFTRAGLITLAISMATFGALVYLQHRRWRREHSALVALAAVLVALVMVSRSPQLLITRMSTGVSQDWYGASYEVPRTLTLRPDSFNDIPVTLSNRGWLTWQSSDAPAFALSYHWLAETEEVVIYDGLRTPFTHAVAPGDDVQLRARVRAPGYPGTYVLVWDVVQEHRTWLSLEGVYPGKTIVTVEGAPAGAPLPRRGRMPSGVLRMPRPVLWETALRIWRDHPWLGIGPDNFRHTYGTYLGLAAWDSRVHANNTYLEVLVGMGLLGVAALAWLIVAALRSAASMVREIRLKADTTDTTDTTNASMPLAAAALTACAAIAAHGVVDSFLTFTSTYVVFAIAAGMLYRHAHRV